MADPVTINPPSETASRDGISGDEIDILNAEAPSETSEPEAEIKPEVEAAAPEVEEKEEELEEEVEPEEEEVEEPKEEERIGAPPFNKLKKEFPQVFKKYPELQSRYFEVEKYRELFPSVDEAGEAAKKSEIFDYFDQSVAKGDMSLVIQAVRENNPSALGNVADNILGILQGHDKNLYVRATTPAFKHLLATAANVAARHSDKTYGENLKNAAAVIAHFIWGDSGIPQTAAPQQVQADPEKEQLQRQHAALLYQQHEGFQGDVYNEIGRNMQKLVEDGLDPENKLTPFVREKLVEQVLKDVDARIQKDPTSTKQIAAIWRNVSQSRQFTEESKSRIKRAYLGRAKLLISSVRAKRLQEVLGHAPKKEGKTIIPANPGSSRVKPVKISSEEVRKKGLSEMDIIMSGVK